jgi:hypothetical protein
VERVDIRKWLPVVPSDSPAVPPERNQVPPWLFCVDCGTQRWYVGFESLVSFGPSRFRNNESILLQFAGRFAFKLWPRPGNNLLGELRASNLEGGGVNKVSVWPDRCYLGTPFKQRYQARRIDFERQDLAKSGDWTLGIRGNPGDKKPEPEKAPAGMEL